LTGYDETYRETAAGEKIGETVRLLGDEIAKFAELAVRVVGHLEKHLETAGSVRESDDADDEPGKPD
jgi:hypothetical protein